MGELLGPDFPCDIGLAVSGGGDSMAMLYLAHNWTRSFGLRLWVVTVDHGLRPESADEAAMVAEECALLGWPHATLRWSWDGRGNLQSRARDARLALIDRWRGALAHVLFAHTRDDQAETVLMRLARGSGVDGLAGMVARREVFPSPEPPVMPEPSAAEGWPPRQPRREGFFQIRPCLDMAREELRHYARTLKGRWAEDPGNDDSAYERARIRKALALLSDHGITAERLAGTARRMERARDALRRRAAEAAERLSPPVTGAAPLPGEVVLERDGFAALDRETQLRLLTGALQYVTGAVYKPRAAASDPMLERILAGAGGTLHGAEIVVDKTLIHLFREWASVAREEVAADALWDGQWRVTAGETGGLCLRALGEEGWRQLPERVRAGVRHRSARALPSLWRAAHLVACPALEHGPPVTLARRPAGQPDPGFAAFLLSH